MGIRDNRNGRPPRRSSYRGTSSTLRSKRKTREVFFKRRDYTSRPTCTRGYYPLSYQPHTFHTDFISFSFCFHCFFNQRGLVWPQSMERRRQQ